MSLNVSNVFFLLHQRFPGVLPTNPDVSRKEEKLAKVIASLIDQSLIGDVDIEVTDEFSEEDDCDWEAQEFEPYDGFLLKSHNELRFGNKSVTRDEALEAISFYRDTVKGTRPLSTMTSRFRWISTAKHMEKLRNYEKDVAEFKESRTNLLKLLGERLYEVVKEKLTAGLSLHDLDIQRFALHINTNEMKIPDFKASQSWITNWKNSHKIVSRRITKFVTRKCLRDQDIIEKTADNFVKVCRREMSAFSPSMIFNSDQTGIQKELHGNRSLSFRGVKRVDALVQAKSSLTHSFTFLPMLFMDGSLGPKAYMLMAEPTGRFPPSRPIPDCKNLVVRAGRTHIMTKNNMRDWLETCVFIPENPKKLFMLVDSWPSFTDHATILNSAPNGFDVTIRNIPPHTTSIIQPLDAHWNGPWKNLIKKFTSYALAFQPDFVIAKRNNEIWMVSLLYHQISAEFFKPFLQYSWKKTGYIDTSSPFETPARYCFDQCTDKACYKTGCAHLAFIICARCNRYICFLHFIVVKQHLCNYK